MRDGTMVWYQTFRYRVSYQWHFMAWMSVPEPLSYPHALLFSQDSHWAQKSHWKSHRRLCLKYNKPCRILPISQLLGTVQNISKSPRADIFLWVCVDLHPLVRGHPSHVEAELAPGFAGGAVLRLRLTGPGDVAWCVAMELCPPAQGRPSTLTVVEAILALLWNLMVVSEHNLHDLLMELGVGVLLHQFYIKKKFFRAILTMYFIVPFSCLRHSHLLSLWDPVYWDSQFSILYFFKFYWIY